MSRIADFLVIGAMKGGTTALHARLGRHPDVFLPERKELDFFVAEKEWRRGLDWYAEQFAPGADAAVVGEVSPNYTKLPLFAGVPERVAATLPDVKLIYLLRHPIERMRSHWLHQIAHGARPARPAARALLGCDDYLQCSSYGMQLAAFREHVPAERVLVLRSEDLRADPDPTLARVCAFLGVDPGRLPAGGGEQVHATDAKRIPRRGAGTLVRAVERREHRGRARVLEALTVPATRDRAPLPPDVVDELEHRLRPDLELLGELAGESFDPWGLVPERRAVVA